MNQIKCQLEEAQRENIHNVRRKEREDIHKYQTHPKLANDDEEEGRGGGSVSRAGAALEELQVCMCECL